MPRRLRTMTSRRSPRNSATRIGTRRSGLATYRSRNRSYVCSWPGFNKVTRLKSSSMSFWTGVAVRSSMYFFERPATNRQFRLKRFLSRWASSTMMISQGRACAERRWGSRFAVSIEAMRNGFSSQSRRDRRTENGRENFVSISSRHWSVRAAGVRTSARCTSPRTAYSLRMSPASIVLPRPTSSARIPRPRISRRSRSESSKRKVREASAEGGGSLAGRDMEGGIPSPATAGGAKTVLGVIIVWSRVGSCACLVVDGRHRRLDLAIGPAAPEERGQDREGVDARQPEVGRLDALGEEDALGIGNPGRGPGGDNLRDERVRHREGRDEDREVQADRVSDVEEGRAEPGRNPAPLWGDGPHDRADVGRCEEPEAGAEKQHVPDEVRVRSRFVRRREEEQGEADDRQARGRERQVAILVRQAPAERARREG